MTAGDLGGVPGVPVGPEAIEAAWLQAMLAGHGAPGGATVTAVRSERIGIGYGLDGTIARLALAGTGVPSTLVAKFASASLVAAEAAFYDKIAPRMPLRLVQCHGARTDRATDRGVLLLEDLSGAVQGDAVVGGTLPQALAVARAMARFHAAFHGASASDLGGLADWDPRVERLGERVRDRMPRYLARFGATLDPRVPALVAGLADALPAAVGQLARETPTLIHADLHMENVLFLPSGEPVILDWPNARRGPAILDVVHQLVEGVTAESRRRHEGTILKAYAEARDVAGAPAPTPANGRAAFEAAVRLFLAYAVAWGGAEPRPTDPPRATRIVASFVRNTAAAAVDHLALA